MPIALEDGRPAGVVNARFLLSDTEEGGTLVVGEFRGNGHSALRCVLGEERADPIGLDGNDNVVGATEKLTSREREHTLEVVQVAVFQTVRTVSNTLGHDLTAFDEVTLKLQPLECTHDFPHERAPEAAHRFSRGAFDASATTLRSLGVERLQVRDEKGYAWLRIVTRQRGSQLKGYAKCPSLLRVEWVLERRRDVSEELGCEAAHPRDGVTDILSSAFALAAEELAPFKEWILEVGKGTAHNVELLLGLRPLLDLCNVGEQRRGPVPQSSVAEQARLILTALLTGGRALTTGLRSGPLRRTLEGLVADGVLVPGRGRRLGFAVAARYVSGLQVADFTTS